MLPVSTAYIWLVPGAGVDFLVYPHAVGVEHVGNLWRVLKPYLDLYVIGSTHFEEQGN